MEVSKRTRNKKDHHETWWRATAIAIQVSSVALQIVSLVS